jgi:hypothetical protein
VHSIGAESFSKQLFSTEILDCILCDIFSLICLCDGGANMPAAGEEHLMYRI